MDDLNIDDYAFNDNEDEDDDGWGDFDDEDDDYFENRGEQYGFPDVYVDQYDRYFLEENNFHDVTQNEVDYRADDFETDEYNNGYYALLDAKNDLFQPYFKACVFNAFNQQLIKCKPFDSYACKAETTTETACLDWKLSPLNDEIEILMEKKFLVNAFISRETFKYVVNKRNKNNFLISTKLTPLLYAAELNNYEMVHELISRLYCDPNITCVCKLSDFLLTPNFQDFEEFMNKKSPRFFRNLAYFCKLISREDIWLEEQAFKKLKEQRPSITHFYSPVMYACKFKNLKMASFLIDHGADCSYLFCDAQTIYDDSAVTKRNLCFHQTKSCLKFAVENFDLNMIRLICEKGNASLFERLWAFYSSHTHVYTLLAKLVKMTIRVEDEGVVEAEDKKVDDFLETCHYDKIFTYFQQNGLNFTFNDLFCLYHLLSRTLYTRLTFKSIELVMKILARNKFRSSQNEILTHIIKMLLVATFNIAMRTIGRHESSKSYHTEDHDHDICEKFNEFDELYLNSAKTHLQLVYSTDFSQNTKKDQYFIKLIPTQSDLKICGVKAKCLNDELSRFVITSLTDKPMKLKQMCRLKIKSKMKIFTRSEIEKLEPLPKSLKDFLYFQDF